MKTTSPLLLLTLVAYVTLLLGCAAGDTGFGFDSSDASPSDEADDASDDAAFVIDYPADDATVPTSIEDPDAGSLPYYFEDAPAVSEDGGAPVVEAPTGPSFDAGEGGLCAQPLAFGDLVIVELMIESTSGTGDHGEWLEVASTLDCALDLDGLSGECPSGAKVNTFAVTNDEWIPARGRFLIADSSDPAVNHDLPGVVVAWSGNQGDVLRNEGATVTLVSNDVLIDSVTYPDRKLTPGVSLTFPADCPPDIRSDWTAWQNSEEVWFPAFLGTPSAPNSDAHCPAALLAPDD